MTGQIVEPRESRRRTGDLQAPGQVSISFPPIDHFTSVLPVWHPAVRIDRALPLPLYFGCATFHPASGNQQSCMFHTRSIDAYVQLQPWD